MTEALADFAVIFDMDGLMIESEHLQSQSIETILRDHGVEPEYNQSGVVQIVGVTAKDNFKNFKEKYSLKTPVGQLLERKNKLYSEILKKGIEPLPGIHDLVYELKKHGVKIAVASSSIPEDINEVLDQLGVADQFDSIISASQVKRGKPAPDIFLKAAESLQTEPRRCAVLEDAQSGIKAGKSAGMKVIAVPSKYTLDHAFDQADLKVGSLEQLSFERISGLFLPDKLSM